MDGQREEEWGLAPRENGLDRGSVSHTRNLWPQKAAVPKKQDKLALGENEVK